MFFSLFLNNLSFLLTTNRLHVQAERKFDHKTNQKLVQKQPLEKTMMKDFFLCHAGEDKRDFVRPLANELQKCGMTCWLDEAEVEWGDNLFKKINEGLNNSQFVIVFLSQNFINKKWPPRELYAALTIEDQEQKKKVLPLMSCDPKIILEQYPLLAEKVYVRFDEGVDRIAIKCQKIINRKTMIVSNVDFPVEDKNEMLARDYRKKENLVYKYSGRLDGNSIRLKTDLAEGTSCKRGSCCTRVRRPPISPLRWQRGRHFIALGAFMSDQ